MSIPFLVLVLLCALSLLGLFVVPESVRRVVPRTAQLIALFAVAAAWLLLAFFGTDEHHPTLVDALPGFAGSLFLGAFVLALGYVYGDARRRGMSPRVWTWAAALVPNLVGFLLYFLVRNPLYEPCARCGRGMAVGQAFCPACGQPVQAPPPAQADAMP